jgi:hypothetical protein
MMSDQPASGTRLAANPTGSLVYSLFRRLTSPEKLKF